MKKNKKPNIVIITADQWRGDCLGLYNNQHPVMTPHVNQLAAEGINFREAYADCPVCMPQRLTMLTGQVASNFGETNNFHKRASIDSDHCLPRILTREGDYQTKAVGKMHFYPERARFGFEHISLHPNDYVNWLEETEYAGMYRGHGLGGNEVYPTVNAVPEKYTHTHWIIDESIEFLSRRDPEHPFFLWMVFEEPHSPFDPPEPYDRMYENISVSSPLIPEWDPEEISMIGNKRKAFKYDHLTEEMLIETRKKYYGQISHIDYQLGRFLGELKTKGLYEDTIIIFTADHGEHLGDYGTFGKNTYLRGSANVPLIIRFPQKFSPAEDVYEIDQPVLTADIFPTLMNYLDINHETETDGISLLNYISEENTINDRTICGEYGNNDGTAFATDGEFKYIYYGIEGREQLFDIKNDPDDLINLSSDNQYHDIKLKLKNELINYLDKHGSSKVKQDSLVEVSPEIDEKKLKRQNPYAWRGPMRYNQGYYG
ncbi:MAG: sulfatase-like hydrolase/transferase [Bacillota bacterium]